MASDQDSEVPTTSELQPTPPTLLSLMQVLCSGTVTNIQQRHLLRALISEFLNNSVTASKVYQNIAQIVGYQTFVDTVEGLVTHYVKQCAIRGTIPVGNHTPILSTGEALTSGNANTPGFLIPPGLCPPAYLNTPAGDEAPGRTITAKKWDLMLSTSFTGIPKSLATCLPSAFDEVTRPVPRSRLRKIGMTSLFPSTRGFPTISRGGGFGMSMSLPGDRGQMGCTAGRRLALHSRVLSFHNVAFGFPSSAPPPTPRGHDSKLFERDENVKCSMWTRFDQLVMMNTNGGLEQSVIHRCGGEVPPVMERSEYSLVIIDKKVEGEEGGGTKADMVPILILFSPFIHHIIGEEEEEEAEEGRSNDAGALWILNMKSRCWIKCPTAYAAGALTDQHLPFLSSASEGVSWANLGEAAWSSAVYPASHSLEWSKGKCFERSSELPGEASPGAGMVKPSQSPQVKRLKRSQRAASSQDGTHLIVVTPSGAVWGLCVSDLQWSCLARSSRPGPNLTGASLVPFGEGLYGVVGGISVEPHTNLRRDYIEVIQVFTAEGVGGLAAKTASMKCEVELGSSVAHFLDEILPCQQKDLPDMSAECVDMASSLRRTAIERIGFETYSLPINDDLNTSSVFPTLSSTVAELHPGDVGPMNGVFIIGGATPNEKMPDRLNLKLDDGRCLTSAFTSPISQTFIQPVYGPSDGESESLPGDLFFLPDDVLLPGRARVTSFTATVCLTRLIPDVTGPLISGLINGLPEGAWVKDLTVRSKVPGNPVRRGASSTGEPSDLSGGFEGPIMEPESLKMERIREHWCDIHTLLARLSAVAFCVLTMGTSYASQYLAFPEVLHGRSSVIDKICRDGVESLRNFSERTDSITLSSLPFIVNQGGLHPNFFRAGESPPKPLAGSRQWRLHLINGLMYSYQGHIVSVSSRAEGFDLMRNRDRLRHRFLEESVGKGDGLLAVDNPADDERRLPKEATKMVLSAEAFDVEDEEEQDAGDDGLNYVPRTRDILANVGEAVKSHALKTLDRECLESKIVPTSGLLANMVFSLSHPFTAIGHLVANSLEAGSTIINIDLGINSTGKKDICVSDNGCGMDYRVLLAALKSAGYPLNSKRGKLISGKHGVGLPVGCLRLGQTALVASRSANHVGIGLISQLLTSQAASLEAVVPSVVWSHHTRQVINPGYGQIDTKHCQGLILNYGGYRDSVELAEMMNFLTPESDPVTPKIESLHEKPAAGSDDATGVSPALYGTGTRVVITDIRDGADIPFHLDQRTGATRVALSDETRLNPSIRADSWMLPSEEEEGGEEAVPFQWTTDPITHRQQVVWKCDLITEEFHRSPMYARGVHALFPFWSAPHDSIDRNLATYLAWSHLHNPISLRLNGADLRLCGGVGEAKIKEDLPVDSDGQIADTYERTLYRTLLRKLYFGVSIEKLFSIMPLKKESIFRQHPDAKNSSMHGQNDHGSLLMGFLNVDESALNSKGAQFPDSLPTHPNGVREAGILFYHNNRFINRYCIPLGASNRQLNRLSSIGTPATAGVVDSFVLPPITCIVELPTWHRPSFNKEGFERHSGGDQAWSHITECIERCIHSYCVAMSLLRSSSISTTTNTAGGVVESDEYGARATSLNSTPKLELELRLERWMAKNDGKRVT
eukprot:GHVH01000363.1.p1 GENE.GHVH01000363.1~~GHVH01000363.1.p1  ORF type:complete len:1640 (+),score=270.68 GHVH01000363.1:4326-9245(+)